LTHQPEPERLLLVNKPYGWSSFQAVKKIKYLFKARKCGHAGTLDPLATGLLIICTGKGTKKLAEYQAQEKEYTGVLVLGAVTPSYDLETEIMNPRSFEHVDRALVEQTLESFRGIIEQVPPVFSAVKIDGKRAYKYARKGESKPMEARQVTVSAFEITNMELPELEFRIACSKGTYIRSLVHDFGQALGCGAYLKTLCRTRIGSFCVDDAKTPAEWQDFVAANGLDTEATI
jgi:tRNA pseudouridine55 synthase